MDIQWHDKCAAVDEVSPKTKVDRGVAAHHPSEEQAHPLARRLGVLGNDSAAAVAVEILADDRDGCGRVGGMLAHIIPHRTVCQQQLLVSMEEMMHGVVFIQAVEASGVPFLEMVFEFSIPYPFIHLTLCPVENHLDFLVKLSAASIAQA